MKIGFAGMTHLGIYSAVAAMEKGFEVETCNYSGCAFVCITQDIQEDENDNIDAQPIYNLVMAVSADISEEIPILIMSQVPVGFCRKIKRKNIFFQADTLRIKDALERAINPEQIVVGYDGGGLPFVLRSYWHSFDCPILHMSYESAEMVQKAININLASQVSVTNTLSEMAAAIGANWDDITRALKNDKRIGEHAYLKPGNGLSSSHLRRDIKTIRLMSRKYGIDTNVLRSFIEHSDYRKAKI